MNGICKVDDGRALREGNNVALRGKNKGLVVEDIYLERTHELVRITGIVLGLDEPGKLDIKAANARVKEICDRVAVMEHGRVVEQGEVFNVFADPRQEITRSFIHTTSNLRKIEELIEEDSPVVQLKPGELIVRLSYIQRNVSEPLISTVSRKFDIVLNIIFSDIAIVQNAPIGGTVAIISGERAQITQAIAYLIEKNVGVEVIRDARISE